MTNIQLPDYARELIEPARFKVILGGRGSAKSFTIAKLLLLKGYTEKHFILCSREFQSSLKDSVHKLLCDQIYEMGLQNFYKITQTEITGRNGTTFIFKGLWGNISSIKSIPGITACWLEEAQTISAQSLFVLEPTIREEGSEIWFSYNPESEDDPVHEKFCGEKGPPPNSTVLFKNWEDNPFFPKVLRDQKDFMYKTNPDLANHVWGGEVRSHSDAQIYNGKWSVQDFEIKESFDGPYFGCDFGFSVDESTIVKVYLDMDKMRLLIDQEAGGVGIDIDHLPKLYDTISESRKFRLYGDGSRPETISYLKRKGFDIVAAEKWKGSVEDSIEWIKSFSIIVRPSCKKTRKELKLYSYKVDRLTGAVTTKVKDGFDHYLDAVKYSVSVMIAAKGKGILNVL